MRSEAFDSCVAQADAQRAAHVADCTTVRYHALFRTTLTGVAGRVLTWFHCARKADTSDIEKRAIAEVR